MIELNEDSMRMAIRQLPQHKAAGYVWEEIRWQLGQPLVSDLPLHTAPETAWQGILAGSAITGQTIPRKIALLTASTLFFIALLLYPARLTEFQNSTYPARQKLYSQTSIDPMTATTTVEGKSTPVTSRTITAGMEHVPLIPVRNPTPVSDPLTVQAEIIPTHNTGSSLHYVLPFMLNNQAITTTGNSGIMKKRNDRKPVDCSPFHPSGTSAFLLMDYEPIFHENRELKAPIHNFSLSTGFRHNKFGFTLGTGFTRLNGDSHIDYAYRQNELIYSYDYVDSVYVDPVTHETYYFTVKVDVYDSIDHSVTEKVNDRYSYLRIPFSVSYELAAFRHLTLHLKFSGAYHLLQDKFRNYSSFSEVSSRLVSTRIEEQKINSDYWSAGAGLMLEYNAGGRIGLNLTPLVQYNFLPVAGSPAKGMAGYGINFGISWKITPG